MRARLAKLWSLIRRYCIIARPGGGFSKVSLVPLAAVVPVAIYAYMIQAVVTTETQRRERNVAALDIRTMSERLRKITSADSITCRDYAHWDETYDEMISRNAKWLDMNIENGLASSFGFTIVLLQGRTGDVVYRKGTSNEALAGIGRYGLLERCLRGSHVSGMARLDGRAYVIVAYPVQRSDDTG
ncbi:MAG: CHASE4 domain-containing protein [Armatimonadota bacterium]